MTHYTRREADLDAALATAEKALHHARYFIDAEWAAVLREIDAALTQIADARKPRPDPWGEPYRHVESTR